MCLYLVAVCYNARQENAIKYNTITHNTQDNSLYSKLQKKHTHTHTHTM